MVLIGTKTPTISDAAVTALKSYMDDKVNGFKYENYKLNKDFTQYFHKNCKYPQ